MKPAFHYIVKAKLIRQIKENEFDFEEINKTFENENPIIAREEAFSHYQSWIDILLQDKSKEYVSDREAREDLISFIKPGATTKLQADGKEIEFSDDSFGNGIGVYFVKDESIESINNFLDIGEEGLIHGILNLSNQYLIDEIIICLQEEAKYYEYFNYETRNKVIEVTYCCKGPWLDDPKDSAIVTYKILKTPFDWQGYDKPYWWGKPSVAVKQPPETIEGIIHQGETNQVEFKTTLHFIEKGKSKIHEGIPKTICAFLNSNGGFLFIGVNDNKVIEGLEFDFSLAKGKDPKDYLRLEFDSMVQNSIDFSIKGNITSQFHEIEEKDILCITVSPSKKRPIFFKGREGQELYVRGEASTRQIKDAEEIINYWKEKYSG